MPETTNDDAAYDARMIRDIRSLRAQLEDSDTWSMRLTLGEVDALLRAVDARDAANRELCGMPDERPRPAVTLEPLRSDLGLDLSSARSSLEHDEPTP